jgi:oligosaccharide reducing-end xylanase
MNISSSQLTRRTLTLGSLASLALAGCGGGGGGETPAPPAPPPPPAPPAPAPPVTPSTPAQPDPYLAAATAKLNNYIDTVFVTSGLYKINPSGTEAYIVDVSAVGTGVAGVKSEGQSYGMMIAVMMNDQTRFNQLWTWTKNHMRYPSTDTSGKAGRLAWLCNPGFYTGMSAQQNGSGAAPDGEIWMVTALHLAADKGWGTGTALRDDANAMCDVMLANPAASTGLLPYFNPAYNLVNFYPQFSSTYTDPSYAAPAFFSYLAGKHNAGAQKAKWDTLAASHRQFLINAVKVNTPGLAAEFTEFDGVTPVRSRSDQDHSYDAWRVTMQQTLDYLWNGDTTSHTAKMQSAISFMAPGISGNNKLNARFPALAPVATGGSYTDIGQVAMYATGYRGGAAAQAVPFVQRLLAEPPQTMYYQSLLCTLSLLILSGKFIK